MTDFPRLPHRLSQIAPFRVMKILEQAQALAAAGHDVIHLEVGEPDFPTPAPIVAAGQAALAAGQTFYTPACGLPALRQAIADFYQLQYGATVDAKRIIVTPGASGALQLALAVLVDRDDEVLLPDPTYPCNRHFVSLLEGRPVGIAVGADDAFQLQARHIAPHWGPRTVAAMVASPANPTGSMLSPLQLAALHAAVQDRGGRLIVDEIYQGLCYDQPSQTALSLGDDLFVINSFSKFFQMTGWRLGWLVAPTAYLPELEKLAQNLFLAPPTLAQHAALAAFQPETLTILEARRQELQQRRDFLRSHLAALGFAFPAPAEGAFYLYADVSALSSDSEALALRLLQEQFVATTPGLDFGEHEARRYLRFAYTAPIPRLAEAVQRIRQALQR